MLGPPNPLFQGLQPQAAEAREPAMAGLEVRLVPMGGGGEGDAKNGGYLIFGIRWEVQQLWLAFFSSLKPRQNSVCEIQSISNT